MSLNAGRRIGKYALQLVLLEGDEQSLLIDRIEQLGFKCCYGHVGAMDTQKIVAAIETTSKKHGLIQTGLYRESHALYHAIMEALYGVTRGQVQLGAVLRTVGLSFSVVRGRPYVTQAEGDWIAVALYGTIGAPVKGLEHETVGLGINHI
ncbi:hut operon positive regulator [Caldalkalibacillus uzonensis]|uniref:Hut operon positive regulatory protein n=1 Tax=Caldalkalibacillus uzonensis TaxID=353224 RepID=A0ABU0CUC0_9BACI|nr:hut operon transcriptional regulator HutP [Caldalkalibacillus uzonensis]MDQ0340012.1 hut operon positive regulator [Caldalkalibacillus uzonensis]